MAHSVCVDLDRAGTVPDDTLGIDLRVDIRLDDADPDFLSDIVNNPAPDPGELIRLTSSVPCSFIFRRTSSAVRSFSSDTDALSSITRIALPAFVICYRISAACCGRAAEHLKSAPADQSFNARRPLLFYQSGCCTAMNAEPYDYIVRIFTSAGSRPSEV